MTRVHRHASRDGKPFTIFLPPHRSRSPSCGTYCIQRTNYVDVNSNFCQAYQAAESTIQRGGSFEQNEFKLAKSCMTNGSLSWCAGTLNSCKVDYECTRKKCVWRIWVFCESMHESGKTVERYNFKQGTRQRFEGKYWKQKTFWSPPLLVVY